MRPEDTGLACVRCKQPMTEAEACEDHGELICEDCYIQACTPAQTIGHGLPSTGRAALPGPGRGGR